MRQWNIFARFFKPNYIKHFTFIDWYMHSRQEREYIFFLAFSTMSFFTKTLGLLFLTWLGVDFLHLNFKIYIPILTLSWLLTHLIEAFTIQSNLRKIE